MEQTLDVGTLTVVRLVWYDCESEGNACQCFAQRMGMWGALTDHMNMKAQGKTWKTWKTKTRTVRALYVIGGRSEQDDWGIKGAH